MIDALITEADALASDRYDSPAVMLWKRRSRAFVEETYGEEYLKVFNNTLRFKRVVTGDVQGQQLHRQALADAVSFLNRLRAEPLPGISAPIDPSPGLHGAIQEGCVALFEDGHYGEAIEKGFKIVRARLRELTEFETGSEAFGKGKLRIGGAAAPHVADDFNQAVKFLTMAIDKFRNEKSHSTDGHTTEPQRAREYLAMSSLAMHLLDQAETPK